MNYDDGLWIFREFRANTVRGLRGMIDSDVLTDSLWLLLQILRHNTAFAEFFLLNLHSGPKSTQRSENDSSFTWCRSHILLELFIYKSVFHFGVRLSLVVASAKADSQATQFHFSLWRNMSIKNARSQEWIFLWLILFLLSLCTDDSDDQRWIATCAVLA